MLDDFIDKFGGWTEAYKFYNDTVELRYDPKEHLYFLVSGDELKKLDGVTNTCHIIDKSDALIPWGCKMMSLKLLSTMPVMTLPTGEKLVPQQAYDDFVRIVLDSKNAHKEKLEEAGAVGHAAHYWIEQYIKAVLVDDEGRKLELLAKFPVDDRAKNCCTAALHWMSEHNVKWICTEKKIFSRQWEYAGTMDGKALVSSCGNPQCCPNPFTDRLSIVDWKSSNYLYLEYLYQTAAYEFADEEEFGIPVEDRWVIRLGKDDGDFDPWHAEAEDFDAHFNGFLLCLQLTRSVRAVKARIKKRSDAIKAEDKRRAKEAKEAALKLRCKNAEKYKGSRKPTCNKGNPCEACLQKYEEVQGAKNAD